MDHPRIRELTDGDIFDGFFAVREKAFLTTASGKPYIRMTLCDATGAIQANLWDAERDLYDSFGTGDVIKVRAGVETYRGALQLKLLKLRPAAPSEYEAALFVPTSPADLTALQEELVRLLDTIEDPDYNNLLHAIFDDAELMETFARAPAARENHHGYLGGLLEHTMSLARLAQVFCETTTTPLNRDLLLTGTLLHDIGKIREMEITTTIEYTDHGKLVGHLVIGTLLVEERAARIENFPAMKKWLVQHLILSHHGKREYGSPVLPATPEALALHHIDNLDAKTVAARRIIDEDADGESHWTSRSWMLETQVFKG